MPLPPEPLEGTPVPPPPNPPPATRPRSLGTLKSVQTSLFDVEIDAKVVADGIGEAAGAVTRYSGANRWSLPSGSIVDGKVVRFKGKFAWRGTIEIQTFYARGVKPDAFSCYGRGTTLGDVRAGNVTLAFHESCHRNDFIAFLKSRPLPEPPNLVVGMTQHQLHEALEDFTNAFNAYFEAMERDSFRRTDEAGHAKSIWLRTGVCYGHRAPGP